LKKTRKAGNSAEEEILDFLEKTKPLVDRAAEKFVPRRLDRKKMEFACGRPRFAYDAESCTKAVNEPIWELLDRGGKRWRPGLFLLFVEALGKDPKKFVDYSIIPELVHNGSLMVDDIEDSSELRRGKPCIHRIYGNDIAINAGNALYYLPLLALLRSGKKFKPSVLAAAYEAYVQELINLSYGQGMDIYWHRGLSKSVSEKQYLQMCAFKTGTLARLSAKLAVILAGGSQKQAAAAAEFAESIGVAFQIQDDVLNLVGDEAKYGKEIGGDISEGKRTLMVIRALNLLPKHKAGRLLQMLDSHTKAQVEIREAISLVEEAGAIDYAKSVARKLVENAWKKLDASFPKSGAKLRLEAFAHYLIERKV